MSNGRPMNSVISWLRRSSQYFTDQPPWANPPLGSSSGPPGACITPSSVRNVVTLSLRIACPPPTHGSHQKCMDRTDRDDPEEHLRERCPREHRALARPIIRAEAGTLDAAAQGPFRARVRPQRRRVMATKFVTSADGTRIAYETMGQGAPLVFVWGALGVRSSPFAKTMREELAKDFTVFDYDRRGRGESGDTKPYAVAREVEDLRAVCEARVPTVVLVGGSTTPTLRAAADATARTVPGATERVIPKQNHGVKPAALRPALVEGFRTATDTGSPNAVSTTT